MFSAGVLAGATDSALYEALNEIKMYNEEGITKDELSFMKSSIGQRDARNYETPFQKAQLLSRIAKYNLDRSYVKKQQEILDDISAEEINAIAKKQYDLDDMQVLVVGDKANVKEGLQRLGYTIKELDKEGNPVKEAKGETKDREKKLPY